MPTVIKKLDANSYQLKDQVVAINPLTKVVKGGKNLSFAAPGCGGRSQRRRCRLRFREGEGSSPGHPQGAIESAKKKSDEGKPHSDQHSASGAGTPLDRAGYCLKPRLPKVLGRDRRRRGAAR